MSSLSSEMSISQAPFSWKQFRRTAGSFQRTFQTPLDKLPPFVATIVSAVQHLKGGVLTLRQVVFEPTHLNELFTSCSLAPQFEHGLSLTATDKREVEALLRCGLQRRNRLLLFSQP
jgi:hypothetical protein